MGSAAQFSRTPYIRLMARANSPKYKVQVISKRIVYRGPVFYVTSERIREPSGIVARRDMVRHQGSVVVMAVEETGPEPRVLLARQFRYAAGQPLWEFPAGRIDHGEKPLAAAKREMLEETGYSAGKWRLTLDFWVSPGFLDETMALYLATDLARGKAQPEEDEVINKRFFPLSQAIRMVNSGKIRDAKTIAGILWLAQKG